MWVIRSYDVRLSSDPVAITYFGDQTIFPTLKRGDACADVIRNQFRQPERDLPPMTENTGPFRPGDRLSDAHIYLICGVIALVVFVVDVASLPLGVAAGVAYVPVVLVALRLSRWQQTFMVAGAVSILTVAGFLLGEPAAVLWMVLANRLIAISAIWLTAIGGNWLILIRKGAAEEKLELAERETDSARLAKKRFLETASNDIRHHLQTLVLINAALGRTTDPEKVRKMLGMQGDALGHLSDLMNSLLDITDIESGEVERNIEDVQLNTILEKLDQEFRSKAEAKNLSLTVDRTAGVVRTDGTLLTQVLRSLMSNAIRYTEKGAVAVNCFREPGGVRVTVRDSGVGITHDHLENIFEEFYRIDNDPAARNNGLGLGLTIVDRIVRLLDIGLDVNSEPGQGSSFSLLLPVA
jgi:signal transduction histidine kinase